MRDIIEGQHVWYELRHDYDRSLSSRTVVEMRAVVERVIDYRFLVIRPYVGDGRHREYCRARRVGRWKVRTH